MRIGFTSTSFRQIKNLEKIVKIASASGADCIEWGGDVHIKDSETAEYAKELCENDGIYISSYGSYYRVGSRNTHEWRRICEIAHNLGADSIRVWLGKKNSELTDDETYAKLVLDAKDMCSAANELNLKVCCECHDNTFNNNTDAFLKIYDDVACDNFRTYFQSRYKRLEYDLDRIDRTFPFTESVHISYSEQMREQFPIFDFEYINKLLEKICSVNFDGNILVEYTYLFSHLGFASCMKKDIEKIKIKVGK